MKNFKAHILIVDDDDRIRDLVKEYLNQNNYLVSTAKDSNDAFEKTKVIKFDLIVLDIMMPGKTGLEFTQDYKKKINTPILLLTAKGEPSERIEGLEVGADDYLTKPFEPKELILRINNILSKIIKKNGKNCKIVLTGGYSYLFKKRLYKKAKIEKDITMHGIVKIYRNFIL